MVGLPCFRSLQLCCACRPERLASISLDARISVGVHVWMLTPPKQPGLDAKRTNSPALQQAASASHNTPGSTSLSHPNRQHTWPPPTKHTQIASTPGRLQLRQYHRQSSAKSLELLCPKSLSAFLTDSRTPQPNGEERKGLSAIWWCTRSQPYVKTGKVWSVIQYSVLSLSDSGTDLVNVMAR
ncbi:hypothetical protein Taro_034592 [Colocasia esculenta]|uniref:Uncharacterized protein n=1 Tax=Colocasia esculenta TaxID=4460 RepID=A0A843WCC9_COLES|nr:hypothetical protein [Colocasia esculenta]